MKARIALLVVVSLIPSTRLAAQVKCVPPPTLVVLDAGVVRSGDTLISRRAIEGAAYKEEKPLIAAQVRLYAAGRLIGRTKTDAQGHFVLGNLSVGRYRLAFQGLGTFDVEVVPPALTQQSFYNFRSTNGCLGWGLDTN